MESKMILIADDDFDMARAIELRLKQIGFSTMRSPDATHALCGAQKINPDLLILDVNMPGGNGMAVCEMLASDPHSAKIPVIIHTGCSDEQTKRRCKELGAHYMLKTPGNSAELNDLVCSLLDVKPEQAAASDEELTRSPVPESEGPAQGAGHDRLQTADSGRTSPDLAVAKMVVSTDETPDAQAIVDCDDPPSPVKDTKQPIVLCIDDDPDVSKSIMIRLRPYGVDVQRAFDGMQGFWTALDTKPDAIILDMQMPDGEGNYVVSRFKDHSLLRDVPIIVLTGLANPAMARTMLSLGVNAYLKKPLVFDELLRELRRHLVLPEEPQSPAHVNHT